MNLLLDTHALLWWLDDHPSMSEKAKESISDGMNSVFVSAAVIWEIEIKKALGKLRIPSDFHDVLAQQPFERLPVTVEHAHEVGSLPNFHRDPFDRMVIAQARVEGFIVVTRDPVFKRYKIPIIQA
jgi:PIN domain nuclease of toxin-antitoxin system